MCPVLLIRWPELLLMVAQLQQLLIGNTYPGEWTSSSDSEHGGEAAVPCSEEARLNAEHLFKNNQYLVVMPPLAFCPAEIGKEGERRWAHSFTHSWPEVVLCLLWEPPMRASERKKWQWKTYPSLPSAAAVPLERRGGMRDHGTKPKGRRKRPDLDPTQRKAGVRTQQSPAPLWQWQPSPSPSSLSFLSPYLSLLWGKGVP